MILVSKCLTGAPCRYNGKGKPDQAVIDFLATLTEGRDYILICPECDGGLSIPRLACEICGGTAADVLAGRARVQNVLGDDHTQEFTAGAKCAVQLAEKHHATAALLKENSPSCGSHLIHDGKFGDGLIAGQGLTAHLLTEAGLACFCEDELDKLTDFINNGNSGK